MEFFGWFSMMMSLPCYRPGRTVPTPSESPAFGPHRLPGRVPFGLRRGIRLSPCNVAGKEVDSKTEKYGKVEEYPQEENSNGGFFPTRDPGAWPPVGKKMGCVGCSSHGDRRILLSLLWIVQSFQNGNMCTRPGLSTSLNSPSRLFLF